MKKIKGYYFVRGGQKSQYNANQLQKHIHEYSYERSHSMVWDKIRWNYNKHFAPVLNRCGHIRLHVYDMYELKHELERQENMKIDNTIIGGYIKIRDIGREEAKLIA